MPGEGCGNDQHAGTEGFLLNFLELLGRLAGGGLPMAESFMRLISSVAIDGDNVRGL